MQPRLLAVCLTGLTLLWPDLARGWNGPGHEIVAQIAWDQLTPAERQAAVGLLRPHPRFEKDLMQNLAAGENPDEHAFREAATWPDLVKNPTNPLERAEDHKPWHYVDYPFDRDGQHGPQPAGAWDGHAGPADLLQAMAMVTGQLRAPATPAPRRAIDLCWVIHLTGDAHQPLHAVSEYSKANPTGDQGGNLIHVATPDNPNTNLHAVWDNLEGRSYDAATLHTTAGRIEREYPPQQLGAAVDVADPKAWAAESFATAKHDVYLDGRLAGVGPEQAAAYPDSVPPLPIGYEHHARAVADERVALAGYRLARLVRSVLHDQPATAPAGSADQGR